MSAVRWGVLTLLLACATEHAAVSRPPEPPVQARGTGGADPPPTGDASAVAQLPGGHEHGGHGTPGAPGLGGLAVGAQLFEGLGDYERPVSTRSPEARAYFLQGLRLTYAFNHDEAARSFARAAQLDGHCAACFWGIAL